jgi:hypothetical protein
LIISRTGLVFWKLEVIGEIKLKTGSFDAMKIQPPSNRIIHLAQISERRKGSDTDVGVDAITSQVCGPPFQYSKWTRSWSGSELGSGPGWEFVLRCGLCRKAYSWTFCSSNFINVVVAYKVGSTFCLDSGDNAVDGGPYEYVGSASAGQYADSFQVPVHTYFTMPAWKHTGQKCQIFYY